MGPCTTLKECLYLFMARRYIRDVSSGPGPYLCSFVEGVEKNVAMVFRLLNLYFKDTEGAV